MKGRLQGKVAVITGGCSGIGLSTMNLFITEGARVIVADIQDEYGRVLENTYPETLRFIHCDVSQEADVAAAIALAISAFGGLDITFNNAGVVGSSESVEHLDADDWDKTMNINVRGMLFGIKHSIAPMKARGKGVIINTASVGGVTTSGPAIYCVSKAAIIQLSRVAALELAPSNIRVNSLLPGIISTPIFGAMSGMTREQSDELAAVIAEKSPALQPLPRSGAPDDIAEACLYLASDAAAFVTGTELRVDGGVTLRPQIAMNPETPNSMGAIVAESTGAVLVGS